MTVENQTGNSADGYYLYASSDGKSDRKTSDVFYRVDHGESVAKSLCKMFANENAKKKNGRVFYYAAASGMSIEEQVLLDEAIQRLEMYDDPDPGIYDPRPSKDMMTLAQFGFRARDWEELLRQRIVSSETPDGHPPGEKGDVPPSPDEKVPEMSAEEDKEQRDR